MSVKRVTKDLDAGTMVITAAYRSPVDQVWDLWANPRLLERWWGPPSHPATVTSHDLSPGALVTYHMTAPDGELFHGGWRVVSSDPPHRLEFQDYFADSEGNENEDLPIATTIVTIVSVEDGASEMRIESRYPSSEALQTALEMGMEEGMKAALSQTDEILGEVAPT